MSKSGIESSPTCTTNSGPILTPLGLHGDLVNDMRHASNRILADLEHQIEFEGQDKLRQLSPRKRIDLLLFYQETLINIIRHSGAKISYATVDEHVAHIYERLGVRNAPTAVNKAHLLGLFPRGGNRVR